MGWTRPPMGGGTRHSLVLLVGLGPSEASSPAGTWALSRRCPSCLSWWQAGGSRCPHLGLVQKYGRARGSRRTGDRGPESEHTSCVSPEPLEPVGPGPRRGDARGTGAPDVSRAAGKGGAAPARLRVRGEKCRRGLGFT